jgi:hypothetical protein
MTRVRIKLFFRKVNVRKLFFFDNYDTIYAYALLTQLAEVMR